MSLRIEKINSTIKNELGPLIDFELRDKNLGGIVTITSVDTAPDLKQSKIFVSMIGMKNNKNVLRELKKLSPYLRSKIAKNINLRITPELIFIFDGSTEYGHKIYSILEDLKEEDKEKFGKAFNEEIDEDVED